MSYVAPHLRNKNVSSKAKAAPKAEKIKVNDFPELVAPSKATPSKSTPSKATPSKATPSNATTSNAQTSNAQTSKPAMDFSKLFNNLDEEVIEKKDELKRGIIKLTKDGIVDSLTPDEREQDDLQRNKNVVSKNMIDYYMQINKQREKRCLTDNNYSPEIVVEEYSSSDTYYSTEESEYAEDDPEQETTEF
jgi:hypothetical protein